MPMKQKTFRSGIFVTASSLSVQILTFVSTVVLARLLDPSDFGIMRFATITLGATKLFSGMGMGPALIASGDDKERAAHHAFVISLSGGVILMAAVLIFAPQLAEFFGRREIAVIVRWMSIGVLAISLRIVPNALLEKDMMFGRRIIPDIASAFVRMIVAMLLAWLGYGVWSLVIAWIAELLVAATVSVIVCPTMGWLKRQGWDRRIAGGLWKFGFTQLRTGLVQYAYNNGDGLIVGKYLGASPLGFYTQAYSLSNLPVRNISQVVNSVLFPAYATIRDNPRRLANAFLNSFQLVGALTMPIAMGLFVLAPELVVFLIGEKWRGSIPILQVFSIMGFVRPLSGATSPLFLSLQRPQYSLRTAILQAVSMFVFIPFLMRWGATGVSIAVVGAFTLGFFFNLYMACNLTGLPLRYRDILGRSWPAATSTAIMVVVVELLKRPALAMAGGTHNIFSLGGLILAGVVTYIGALLVLKRSLLIETIQLVTSSLGRSALPARLARGPFRRILSGARSKNGFKSGYPEEFPEPLLQDAVHSRGGGHIAQVRYQHLSGWKQRGSFRVLADDDRRQSWSFIYKNAVYGAGEEAAFEGLPVHPGPPEFAVYRWADNALQPFLPRVYGCDEVEPGKHYRYLFEDLGADYTTRDEEESILRVCGRLPEIHAAIDASVVPEVRDRMLRFDDEFSRRLLPYAKDNLARLAERKASTVPNEWLAQWEQLERTYTDGLAAAFDRGALVPLHGDLNVTNVLFHRTDRERIKLVDWEWAGFGLPESELASLLKAVSPEVEARALAAYGSAAQIQDDAAFARAYRWCCLQRGMFDAAFFARQIVDGGHKTRINLDRHFSRALGRARAAWVRLESGV